MAGWENRGNYAGVPPRSPIQNANFLGMIKNFFSSKITATASPECVVIGLKMLDSEAHALRLVGLVLLVRLVKD